MSYGRFLESAHRLLLIGKFKHKKSKQTKKGEVTMTLVKFNPMRDLVDFEREFNRMFNSLENRFGISKSKDTEAKNMRMLCGCHLTDIYEDKENYTLKG
jgi:hypothetical protein